MRLGGRLLFAASLLLVAQNGVDAEIDRVSIKEVLMEPEHHVADLAKPYL